ncbi:MAG: hypothetical protein ABJO09_07335 [Hyphomicrobiales bacterium]
MFISRIARTVVLLAATTSVAGAAITSADAAERLCKYEVRAKADHFSSFTIPNGLAIFQGKARNTNNNRGFARFHAADAAMDCMAAAVRGGRLPTSCRGGAALRSNASGRALNFNLDNLKTRGYNALCSQTKRGGSYLIRNAQIYTYVLGSRDVRRECSLPANSANVPNDNGMAQGVPRTSRYKVWHRDTVIRCSNGRASMIN